MLVQIRKLIADLIAPELRERRNLLERAVNTDALTQLANRRAFDLASPAAAADPNLSFVVFDLNSFKQVNDTLGHAAGDKVLIDFARKLEANAHWFKHARVFRVGGDEFVAIVENKFAESFRALVETDMIAAGRIIVTASGTIGSTFEDADAGLNTRKVAHKALAGNGATVGARMTGLTPLAM